MACSAASTRTVAPTTSTRPPIVTEAGGKVSKDRLTQVGLRPRPVGLALEDLGIEHMAAYWPEARAALGAGVPDPAGPPGEGAGPLWWAGAGITEIKAANRFIVEVCLPEHNARFAVAPEQDGSAFVACAPEQWRELLCRHEIRQVGNDNSVKWRGLRPRPSGLRPRPSGLRPRPSGLTSCAPRSACTSTRMAPWRCSGGRIASPISNLTAACDT